VTYHPRERRIGRRTFLTRSAWSAAALAVGPTLLSACGDGNSRGDASPVPLSRPDSPVTLPLYDDIPPIADGLEPESGTLKVYNYAEYLAPATIRGFRRAYDVDVEVTTFTSMDQAISHLSGGEADFDVFFATTDVLAKLVLGKLLQPLNPSYLDNRSNLWDALQDPFYDQGARYSVPYTLFTTGIGYRRDRIATPPEELDNPYDVFWDEQYTGDVFVLDDDREVLGMAMLRAAQTDVNTEDADQVDAALQDILDMSSRVNVRVGSEAYTVLPEGRTTIHQMWAGDAVNAQYYLPRGETIENVGYWYPAEGGGMIGSDQMTIMADAPHPVLAHHFLNYLLDVDNAVRNFSWLGYQPPQRTLDPDRVVADGYVPEHLATTVIRPQDFENGHQLLQLSLQGDQLWNTAWSRFSAGA
jgi:spermidine/putrescine transport system substrate-binding protein